MYRTGLEEAVDRNVDILRGSYRNVTSRLDARLVLDHYSARNVFEHRGNNGPELVHSCLIDRVDPHHSNGDEKPSAHLNVGGLQYHCWSYGGGDIFWFVFQMEQSVKKGQQVLSSLLQGTGDGVDTQSLLEDLNKLIHGDKSYFSIPYYHERVLRRWAKLHPYLYEDRRIDPEVLMKHQVGYDEDEIRLIFPHFWRGRLVGWQKRRLDFMKYPMTPPVWRKEKQAWVEAEKYKNSVNFPKHNTLYNLPEKADTVIVVESVMSTLAGESAGLPMPIVATFGAKLTEEQIRYLRAFKNVILWFDPDKAGRLATLYVWKHLHQHTNVLIVDDSFPEAENDLADWYLEGANLGSIIESAQPMFLLERKIRDALRQEVQPDRGREGR